MLCGSLGNGDHVWLSHRILWLFVHAADEATSSYGLFALLSKARSFIAVDF